MSNHNTYICVCVCVTFFTTAKLPYTTFIIKCGKKNPRTLWMDFCVRVCVSSRCFCFLQFIYIICRASNFPMWHICNFHLTAIIRAIVRFNVSTKQKLANDRWFSAIFACWIYHLYKYRYVCIVYWCALICGVMWCEGN